MIPPDVRRVLPPDTAATWERLASLLPDPLYLAGGTAIAVHLKHRESHDLDFFYHEASVDLDRLERELTQALGLAVTERSLGTLNGVISKTKVQFLHADRSAPQRRLDRPTTVAGLGIAGMRDLLAMKLRVIGDRGELRDYLDIMRIEQDTTYTVEQGLSYFVARFQPRDPNAAVLHVLRGLGYLGDVEDDLLLPLKRRAIESYWMTRQPQILREIERTGIQPLAADQPRLSGIDDPAASQSEPGHDTPDIGI